MRGERLKHTINLLLRLSSAKRMEYLKKHHVFASVGENSTYMGRVVPLYANLIKIGNNVRISSQVSFICHDTIHIMLNKHPDSKRKQGRSYPERIGCIEIGDNVFIGTGTKILYNVKIGSNVIIGAGSLVNKDLESGGIYGGIPARRIGDFDAFWEKRINTPYSSVAHNQRITREEIDAAWAAFYEARKPAPKD